jgi:tetratricopeptide (TPR) repeat protein
MTTRLSIAASAAGLLAVASLAACAGGAAAPPPAAATPRRDAAAEAYAARRARDFARAEAIASEEIDAGRAGARLFFERAVARMELGRHEEALADLRRVNEIQEDPQALLLAGSIELRLARWADAEKDLARAVVLAPKNARAWASLAQARIALRDLPGASAALGTATSISADDPFVREVGERLALAMPRPPVEGTPPAGEAAAPAPAAAASPSAAPVTQPAAASPPATPVTQPAAAPSAASPKP